MQEAIQWDTEVSFLGNSVKQDVPCLFSKQVETVEQIERRFEVGKGRMITDGTGTGKTLVGLGVAKRFSLRGKKNIIIITPTDDKCKDWILEANKVNLFIVQLDGVQDKGYGVRTTTYANYYQNLAILREEFDLIIYDECHYIMQNSKGNETSCFEKHKIMCSLPSVCEQRGRYFVGPAPYVSKGPNDLDSQQHQELKLWRKRCHDKGVELYHRTKVLFLSATPFAYHKTIKYCDGLLWDIEETFGNEDDRYNYGYNQAFGFDKFLVDNFGYQMKNNKLQKPDVEVDVSILEREFFEKASEQNLMSTRVLDLPVDYSRHFIKVDTEIGLKMDEFQSILYSINDERMRKLRFIFQRHFNYIFTSKMLESAKAEKILDRIDIHLMLDRKVVIFHGFNNVDIEHPFYITSSEKYLLKDEKWMAHSMDRELAMFYKAYPEWKSYDLRDMKSVPEIIGSYYKNRCAIYNGTVNKKKRRELKDEFMDDDSEISVIVIQSQAGKEGISLHDVTGEHQRVLIDLSLPIRPTESIQKEGRVYRYGTVSNAIYEYPTLQTTMERNVFAYTVAERAKTVENLAMGNLARDLETAFKQGYENFEEDVPTIAQGRLGKKEDKKLIKAATPFEKACTYYHLRQQANSKRKHYYKDFFATPEPLGFKMVEWANIGSPRTWLDPSCGDGAIARFFPENSKRIGIDVDSSLLSLAKLKVNIDSKHMDFMDYKINNKADRIIMNPPFGHGGKDGVEHLLKALIHLAKDGWGLLYCILPCGPSADKKFDEMMEGTNMKFFKYTGNLLLPACTFSKAGTRVMTRVVKFEGINYNSTFRQLDFTGISRIDEFFREIEHLKF